MVGRVNGRRPSDNSFYIYLGGLIGGGWGAEGSPHDEPTAETATPPPLDQAHHHHEHERLTEEERLVLAMSGRCCSYTTSRAD